MQLHCTYSDSNESVSSKVGQESPAAGCKFGRVGEERQLFRCYIASRRKTFDAVNRHTYIWKRAFGVPLSRSELTVAFALFDGKKIWLVERPSSDVSLQTVVAVTIAVPEDVFTMFMVGGVYDPFVDGVTLKATFDVACMVKSIAYVPLIQARCKVTDVLL